MNTPQRYYCTLQQSKRLRELGVGAPSMFYWELVDMRYTFPQPMNGIMPQLRYGNKTKFESYPAYTVGELGQMLPSEFKYKSARGGMVDTWIDCFNNRGTFYCQLRTVTDDVDMKTFYSESEAIVRCDVLIHLLENNLIDPSQVNNQLK